MKRKHLIVILICITNLVIHAQVPNWTYEQVPISPSENAKLGTKNSRSLRLVTNDTVRVLLDSTGKLQFRKYAGNSSRLLVVDENGNLTTADRTTVGSALPNLPCTPGSLPWYLGGNSVQGTGNNIIGTCNERDFILQANLKKSLIIASSNGFVGLGENNTSPTAVLDIKDPSSISNPIGARTLIHGDYSGAIETTDGMNLFYGSSLGSSFNVIQGNLNGTSNALRLAITSSGYIGLNVNPLARFHLHESSPLGSTIGNNKLVARISGVVNNNTLMHNIWFVRTNINGNWTGAALHDGLSVDGQYLTPGADTKTWWQRQPADDKQTWGTGATTYMTLQNGKLYIGQGRPLPTGVAANASLTVDGMILAKDLRIAVSTQTHWVPDYVFESKYKLMPLKEVEDYVKINKHLPDIPSEKDILSEGLDMTTMNLALLKKVEELYLYTIDLNNKVNELEKQVNEKEKTKRK